MEQENKLKLLDDNAIEIVNFLANGKIDPMSALDLFRKCVNKAYPDPDDKDNFFIWYLLYNRFNSYLLLSLLKSSAMQLGLRGLHLKKIDIDDLWENSMSH